MAGGRLIHVRLPEDLLRQLDEASAAQPRSTVIAAALRQYLRIRALEQALDQGNGLLAESDSPWQSDEDVDGWVEKLRTGWTPNSR